MIKKNIIYLIVVLSSMFMIGCHKDNENEVDVNDTNIIIDDFNDNSNEENKNTYSLVDDVESISKEEDNSYEMLIGSDIDNNDSTSKINYSLERLTFGDWGFEISIPKSLVDDYTVVDNLSEINISSVEDISKTYVISSDESIQIFNLDDKYFGIFIDKEIYNENWEKAIKENLYDYIKQIIPDNTFYTYIDYNSPSTKNFGSNAILLKYPVNITPTSSDDMIYKGYIGYLTIDNVVYYILYGETILYNNMMKDNIYSDIVFSSIDVSSDFIKEENKENKENNEDLDYEFLDKIDEETLPSFPVFETPTFK